MGQELERSFVEVVGFIQKARHKAYQAVNTVLIDLYWQVGEYVSDKVKKEKWGKSVVRKLSDYLQEQQPDLQGFSAPNIWRMKQFYEMYATNTKLSTLLRELPWSANLHILSKCKSIEEKEFYIRLAIKERWPVRELARQIDGGLYERIAMAPTKLSTALRELHSLAEEVFRDSYVLEFLNLPEEHSEGDLQQGLVANLKKFILEIGRDFSFVGEKFPLQVGNKDFFVDLLFYHRGLSCLVAFELKIDDFKPSYLGQLSFYLEALDRDVRKPNEKPSVGILLCKSKDAEVVEYALSRTLSPALVAEYQTRLPDKSVLQQKLHEFYKLASDKS